MIRTYLSTLSPSIEEIDLSNKNIKDFPEFLMFSKLKNLKNG
jgi:hypothetical protein